MFDLFDAVMLARIQFAFTVSAHIIFPAFTIGLASYLAVLEGLWLWTRDACYMRVFDYWKTIFAVVFGMGVVSGIVMSFQFGTNWSYYSHYVGDIFGAPLAIEALMAFFLGNSGQLKTKGRVVDDAHMGHQGKGLEYHGHIPAAQFTQFLVAHGCYICAVIKHLARCRLNQAV